jgi:hypothetical protein
MFSNLLSICAPFFNVIGQLKLLQEVTCEVRCAGFGMARPIKVRPVTSREILLTSCVFHLNRKLHLMHLVWCLIIIEKLTQIQENNLL